MKKYPSVLRCYARPEGNHYISICLELNLIDQGKTLEESITSLEENIAGYLESLTPETLPHLFPRPAPFYTYLDYCRVKYIYLLEHIFRRLQKQWLIFNEPILMKPRLANGQI